VTRRLSPVTIGLVVLGWLVVGALITLLTGGILQWVLLALMFLAGAALLSAVESG
jgi:hypothetical protein